MSQQLDSSKSMSLEKLSDDNCYEIIKEMTNVRDLQNFLCISRRFKSLATNIKMAWAIVPAVTNRTGTRCVVFSDSFFNEQRFASEDPTIISSSNFQFGRITSTALLKGAFPKDPLHRSDNVNTGTFLMIGEGDGNMVIKDSEKKTDKKFNSAQLPDIHLDEQHIAVLDKWNKMSMIPESGLNANFVQVQSTMTVAAALNKQGQLAIRGMTPEGRWSANTEWYIHPNFSTTYVLSSLGPSRIKSFALDMSLIVVLENGAVFEFGYISYLNSRKRKEIEVNIPNYGVIELTDMRIFAAENAEEEEEWLEKVRKDKEEKEKRNEGKEIWEIETEDLEEEEEEAKKDITDGKETKEEESSTTASSSTVPSSSLAANYEPLFESALYSPFQRAFTEESDQNDNNNDNEDNKIETEEERNERLKEKRRLKLMEKMPFYGAFGSHKVEKVFRGGRVFQTSDKRLMVIGGIFKDKQQLPYMLYDPLSSMPPIAAFTTLTNSPYSQHAALFADGTIIVTRNICDTRSWVNPKSEFSALFIESPLFKTKLPFTPKCIHTIQLTSRSLLLLRYDGMLFRILFSSPSVITNITSSVCEKINETSSKRSESSNTIPDTSEIHSIKQVESLSDGLVFLIVE
ncbi:uncharacterized protein MONOS_1974 [Monocercomonoides exilis]|uniref:uncharacterized protein n=1 Tax=Monocercomonoides exilis TaxID=2049356 RepID=UPI00355A58DC|nr:hypothetical protein MONOS_1974 [Monocercomonoides exilis]|eukprot:MONOS_1974.1-p1 / transcript=MONOS_1974.1 / gene=MONOS_1974 / organism=Monocercomonoides_exilis_PA203 / gene_product=unspecified product / transcript_product=unspecified product / location=Mono_scaffold00038:33551-36437(+) / protein_length=628 / sequence_SO=supercontig / SO=protein_coding / is_pseudo=false